MKKWRLALLIPVFLILPWCCTGGCAVSTTVPIYSGSYHPSEHSEFSATFSGKYQSRGIPYLWLRKREVPPNTAHFSYKTTRWVDGEAVLDLGTLRIRRKDGSVIDLLGRVEQPLVLVPKDLEYIQDGIPRHDQWLEVHWHIDDCLPETEPITVEVKGILKREGKVVERMDTNLNISPEFETEVWPMWLWKFANEYAG